MSEAEKLSSAAVAAPDPTQILRQLAQVVVQMAERMDTMENKIERLEGVVLDLKLVLRVALSQAVATSAHPPESETSLPQSPTAAQLGGNTARASISVAFTESQKAKLISGLRSNLVVPQALGVFDISEPKTRTIKDVFKLTCIPKSKREQPFPAVLVVCSDVVFLAKLTGDVLVMLSPPSPRSNVAVSNQGIDGSPFPTKEQFLLTLDVDMFVVSATTLAEKLQIESFVV